MDRRSDLDGVFDAANRVAWEPRSAVTDWLYQNARGFQEELKRRYPDTRRIPWKRLAAGLFASKGIGSNGNAITGKALRDAWYRVRIFLKDQGADWVEFREPPRGRKRLAKRRVAALGRVSAGRPVPVSAVPVLDPTAVEVLPELKGLLDEMDADRPWVPKAGNGG